MVAATEENEVVGLDAITGNIKWSKVLGPSWPAATVACGDLIPDIGITGTPVYDPATAAVYVVAKTNDGPDVEHPNYRMHALDLTTGAEKAGWPVVIAGNPTNGGPAFVPRTANQRPALTLMGGRVFVAFASHCDHGPYVGYVGSVSTTTRALSLWSVETGTSTDAGGIWQSGGGPVSDRPGSLLVATGNGVAPPVGPGAQPPGTLGESVVRLNVSSTGTMTAVDFFSPTNSLKLNEDDADPGAGGPVALPDSFGTTGHPHLLAIAGKGGQIYLLDRDNLGGMGQGPNRTNASLSEATMPNGVWGHPTAFASSDGRNYLYVTPRGSAMQVFTVTPNGSGVPTLTRVAASSETFGYTSGSPIVTSTGGDPNSALVWVMRSENPGDANATLYAYDAVPQNGIMHVRYQTNIGPTAKFVQPATDNGRVYVATNNGKVLSFGRPATTPITAPPVDFGYQPVNVKSAPRTLVLTAHQTLSITSRTVPAPFTLGAVTLPRTLTNGQTLSVPAAFTPTATAASRRVCRSSATAAPSRWTSAASAP